MKKIITISKFVFLIFFSFIILNLKNITVLFSLSILMFISIQFYEKKRELLDRIKTLIPVGFLILVTQIIFFPAISLLEKLTFSTLVFLRLINVSLSVFFFVAVTSASDIVEALSFLPNDAKLILTMTFYFIPVIFSESNHIKIVQKSKGYKLSSWNIAPLIVPLIHRVFTRTKILSISMVSKGLEV